MIHPELSTAVKLSPNDRFSYCFVQRAVLHD